MLTIGALVFAGIVLLTFFFYPNPNANVKSYRFKLAMQRNILVLANFALLPLTVFLGNLFYNAGAVGFVGAIPIAFAAMWSIWYVYAICIVVAVLASIRMTETIGKQVGKMKRGGSDLFKGAVPGPANLQQDVADMCRYLRIKNTPQLYILPADGPPNAFAIGVHNGQSAVALHGSLLTELTPDELNAVIAHELGHIAAGDMHVKVLDMLVDTTRFFLLLFMLFSFPSFLMGVVSVFVTHALVKIINTYLDLGLSRRAEFNADAVAVEMQSSGVPMSNALLKLEKMLLAEAPMMMAKVKKQSRWLKTHPPLEERVNACRKLRVD